jgi:hypothetical protein
MISNGDLCFGFKLNCESESLLRYGERNASSLTVWPNFAHFSTSHTLRWLQPSAQIKFFERDDFFLHSAVSLSRTLSHPAQSFEDAHAYAAAAGGKAKTPRFLVSHLDTRNKLPLALAAVNSRLDIARSPPDPSSAFTTSTLAKDIYRRAEKIRRIFFG